MKLNTELDTIESARMEVPDWDGRAMDTLPASSGTLLDKASTLSEDKLRVRGLSSNNESSNYNSSGLMSSGIQREPITLEPSELNQWATESIPVDEQDMADWMIPATQRFVHTKARANEYGRAGGSLSAAGGGAYLPPMDNGKVGFKAEPASDVSERGSATVVTVDGSNTMSIDAPGANTIITENGLHWGAATNFQEQEWVGALLSVEELANNPSDPIGFPRVEGHTGPLFVGHEPSRPSILNKVTATVKTDMAQTIKFKLRSSRDYTKAIREFDQDVKAGKNTVEFRLFSLGIDPMVMEIQPEDGTKTILTDYSVFP